MSDFKVKNGLTATGNVTGSNVTTAGQFISTVAIGTAPLVVTSTTTVANLSVENSGTAGTVTTAAQPNITSTGTLTSLNVTGSAAAGNLSTTGNLTVSGNVTFTGISINLGSNANSKITGGSTGQVLSTDGAGNLSWVPPGAPVFSGPTFTGTPVTGDLWWDTDDTSADTGLPVIGGAVDLGISVALAIVLG